VARRKKKEVSRKFEVGIDPGLAYTAMVLARDNVPIRSVCVAGPSASTDPLEVRCRRLAMFCMDYLQQWITTYELEHLHVMLELPYLRERPTDDMTRDSRILKRRLSNVETYRRQMVLFGFIAAHLFDFEDCVIYFAGVNNKTVKAAWSGDGNAAKSVMVNCSAWVKRPDVECREHLADAQAIGNLHAEAVPLVDTRAPLDPIYVDSSMGRGPHWKNKWPANGRTHPWTRRL